MAGRKQSLKHILGELPYLAALSSQFRLGGRQEPFGKKFSLRRVEQNLPAWIAQAQAGRQSHPATEAAGRKVLVFATLRYWIEHATLLSLALSGMGHRVTLSYLAYANWRRPVNSLVQRQLARYAQDVLQKASPLVDVRPLNAAGKTPAVAGDSPPHGERAALPAELATAIRGLSVRDVQYTLQVEEIDPHSKLFRLRQYRNTQAAFNALALLQEVRPDVVVTPNGSILEMGAVYQAARFLGLPVVTYEFGEQRGRIWLAHNAEVMHQETGDLWQAFQGTSLGQAEWERIRALLESRQQASLWQNFSRLWQGQPSQGGEAARQQLGLDDRPLVVLPANVIGDSLTLGRQVFTESMTEWLRGTVRYFAGRPDVQLVVRIHPGERYVKGPSVADVVQAELPDLKTDPALSHIRLVAAGDPVNTYDLVEIADLGLVYTTTVGMELAMSGAPTVVAGQTHYRGKGFTLDPSSWDEFSDLVEAVLAQPAAYRLSREQLEQAWNYAYRFFFDYPLEFPWHLLQYWKDLEEWPVERVLSAEGRVRFGEAFDCLAGYPRTWKV